jgi:hypothetical protein
MKPCNESARFSPGYEVTRFEAVHREAGYSGSVDFRGGRLEYVPNQGGTVRTASEDVTDPVVTGPSPARRRPISTGAGGRSILPTWRNTMACCRPRPPPAAP